MTIDIEKLRNKLDCLKNPEKKQYKSYTWSPPKKDGEDKRIRLVEYPFGEDPFVELWFHYKIGNKSILCPRKNDGRECPICEFAHNLWQSKDKDDLKIAKTLSPTQRIYAVIFDRSDAELSPKYWGFGVTIYQKLIETLVNPRTRHMIDTEKGFDITVSSVQKPGKKYREVDFRIEGEDTPLADASTVKKLIDSIKPVSEVFKPMTVSEIKKALDEWLKYSPEEAENNSSVTERGGSSEEEVSVTEKEESNNSLTSETIQDIDDAFEAAISKRK